MWPIKGSLHVWSKKTLDSENTGTFKHGVAEVLTVIA